MRHRKKGYKLGRTASHRQATLASLSTALIEHKRITTTLTKAKALRMFVEPVINRAKEDTSHNRRQAFRQLRNKHAVRILFDEVSQEIGDRPGGYTRVVKLGQRAGDGAEMAVIELVDFNDVQPEGASGTKRRRRTRRGGGGGRRRRKGAPEAAPAAVETVEEAVEEAVETAEDVVEDAVETVSDLADDAVEAVEEVIEDAAETVEDLAESAVEAVTPDAGEDAAPEASSEEEEDEKKD